jgi:hypothetical protein
MVMDTIRKGYSYTKLVTALDGVRPLNNVIRKECFWHFIQLQWGHLGQGVMKKVQECVTDAFCREFPAPDGVYMGHRDSYDASALCQDRKKVQEFPVSALFEDEGSDTSSGSETRLEEEEEDSVEEDNAIVDIESEVKSDEDEVVAAETEDVVVPETQYSVQVVVFET